ncbi:Helix-turn-helix domain protein [Candidatus Izimaplasma bacterium HR1]|jgi:transcriptional regulator with XRE-family HTH domain|uniref:helix-turn-helix domain-containing protein n=1 Tax=Candidatus Izimoplasma sp. HR1 TaxID=1541959 RepID=UPI0004F5F43B|nr:Helix-turn-helix domain protein [Candidatus Izimaplasma bacterium HR1]
MNNLGTRLKRIREDKGFPQKLIADHLGLHRSNYSKIESNIQRLTPKQIKLFCEFCDVSADYLLGVESKNKVVISTQDRDELVDKIEYIKSLLNK